MAGPVVDLVVERNQRLVATDANMRTRTRTTSAPPFLLHATFPSPPPPFDAQGRWSGSNRCSRKVARRVWYGGHCPLPPPLPSFSVWLFAPSLVHARDTPTFTPVRLMI